MASSWRHFHSYLYASALKDHLAPKQIITQNCWIRNTVIACTWAWNWRTSAFVVLSIKQGIWKNWGRSLSIWVSLNEWMNEWISEVLSMLFECLDLWIPYVFRQRELALSPIQRKVWLGVWMDAWVSDSSPNTASVANTCSQPCPVDRSTLQHTDWCRTPDWCSCHRQGAGRTTRGVHLARGAGHVDICNRNTGRGEI